MAEIDRTAAFFEALDGNRFDKAESILAERYNSIDREDKLGLFWTNNNSVYLNVKRSQWPKARQAGQNNMAIAEDLDNLELKHIALHQLAYIEREAKNYNLALDLIGQEIDVISQLTLTDSEYNLAHSVAGYEDAYLHFLMGDLTIAETKMRTALDFALLTDDEVAKACAYRGLGEILADIQYLEQAKMIFSEIGDTVGELEVDELIKALK